MSQNAQKLSRTTEEVDKKLHDIMRDIHAQCTRYGNTWDHINYVQGANIAWFIKVADAMITQWI
jgi:glutamate dehydrogenase (NADP+)